MRKTKVTTGDFSMDRKKDGKGYLSVDTRLAIAENAPPPDLFETQTSAKTAIVLPAYDPVEAMLPFVRELRKAISVPVLILVVDDGSDSAVRAKIFPHLEQISCCVVLHHDRNRGKGAALKTAFRYLLERYENDPGFLGCVTADCDGQHSVPDIREAVDRFLAASDDLLLGCRTFHGGNVPWKSRFGNLCTCILFKKFLRIPVSDTQTGLRAIPRTLMKHCLAIRGNRFEFETEMLLTAKQSGCAIREYPIRTIYFDKNSGTHFHPVRDAFRIYSVLFRFLFARLFRFTLSALSSALLDVGLFSLFFYCLIPDTWSIRIAEQTWSLRILLSCLFARIGSSLWNFYLNRGFVFGRHEEKRKGIVAYELLKYYLLAAVILTVSWLLTEAASLHVPEQYLPACKLLIDAILFFVSYFAQRCIVFRRKE